MRNTMKKSAAHRFWETVDWTLRDEDIEADMGYSKGAARLWRIRLGMPPQPSKPRKPQPSKHDWASVDWGLRDTDIAIALGCSRERARQMRRRLNKPNAVKHRWQPLKSPRVHEWFVQNKSLSGTMTSRQVGEILGCHEATARRIGLSHGFKFAEPPTIRPWDDIDWRLPNSALTKIWRAVAPPSQHASFYFARARSVQRRPKALWGMHARCAVELSIGYQIAVENEQRKADAWFKEQERKAR